MSSNRSQTLYIARTKPRERMVIKKAKLLVVSGDLQGREFIVAKDIFTIGTGRDNDLILHDGTVSSRHCEIEITPNEYLVRDLGSTNGTLTQGVRVTEAFLEEGMEIQLGQTKMVFCPLQEMKEFVLSNQKAFGNLLGSSVAMRRVFHDAETYAPTDATLLIEGETGTGKEVLAEEIHRHSLRKNKPFIVIDCAALARELIESELFGHQKGSFTGASTDRIGAFEHADGGTVFLDEIADLSPALQPKLLRVLEKKEIRRLGSNAVRNVNVRIISATNKKLSNEVQAGTFREDLFFRLSVAYIELPPLRRRKDDIPMFSEVFLKNFLGDDAMAKVANFDKAMDVFRNHTWPGNVRELKNLIEIASYSHKSPIATDATRAPVDLSAFLYMGRLRTEDDESRMEFTADRPFKEAKNDLVRKFEAEYVRDLLERYEGNVSRGAREAGIERAYLQRLIRKHELR